jgi:hypothetical protein
MDAVPYENEWVGVVELWEFFLLSVKAGLDRLLRESSALGRSKGGPQCLATRADNRRGDETRRANMRQNDMVAWLQIAFLDDFER